MSVTQKEIAEKVGVSQSLVARVLKGYPHIALETQEKVLTAARDLGYNMHSNGEARALAARRHKSRSSSFLGPAEQERIADKRPLTGFVGLVGAALSHPGRDVIHWMHLVNGVNEVVNKEERRVLLLSIDSAFGWENVDGVLIVDRKIEKLPEWVSSDLDYVSLLNSMEGAVNIVADDFQAGCEATRHLLSLGHRRIAHVLEAVNPIPQKRFEGYLAAMNEAGIAVEPGWVKRSSLSPDPHGYVHWGQEVMNEWLHEGWKECGCTALIAQNDSVAVGSILAFQEACLSVPKDVSVIGFDGTGAFEHFKPKLTSVDIPLREIGATGAQVLLNRIWNRSNGLVPARAEDIVVPVKVKAGQSTRPYQ